MEVDPLAKHSHPANGSPSPKDLCSPHEPCCTPRAVITGLFSTSLYRASSVKAEERHLIPDIVMAAGSTNGAPGEQGSVSSDYDLGKLIESNSGLRQGLTSYGDAHFSLFLRKVFIKALGYSEDALSRPIIGVINTYSSFSPCHGNVPQLIEAVKRGVQLQGGLCIDFPTISLHESFASPTSMFLRNLMSMDTEEMIRAQPVDACVMIGGTFHPYDLG